MPISYDSLIAAQEACARQSDLAYERDPDIYNGSIEAEAQWAVCRSLWFYSCRFLDAAKALAAVTPEEDATPEEYYT